MTVANGKKAKKAGQVRKLVTSQDGTMFVNVFVMDARKGIHLVSTPQDWAAALAARAAKDYVVQTQCGYACALTRTHSALWVAVLHSITYACLPGDIVRSGKFKGMQVARRFINSKPLKRHIEELDTMGKVPEKAMVVDLLAPSKSRSLQGHRDCNAAYRERKRQCKLHGVSWGVGGRVPGGPGSGDAGRRQSRPNGRYGEQPVVNGVNVVRDGRGCVLVTPEGLIDFVPTAEE